MSNEDIFKHRSARIIAFSRIAIAVLFGAWIWLDPLQPVRGDHVGALIFASYLLIAVIVLPLAWRNWWFDFHTAAVTYLIDCGVFFAALYFTQSRESDLISPFTTFFVYLVVVSVLRWTWLHALRIALALSFSFVGFGLFMAWLGLDIDIFAFCRRASFMGLLSILLIWFARERDAAVVPRFIVGKSATQGELLSQLLSYAAQNGAAAGAAMTWAADEEPHMDVLGVGELSKFTGPLQPSECEAQDNDGPMLFDLPRRRALGLAHGMVKAWRAGDELSLPTALGLSEGLLVPLRGAMGSGDLILCGVEGLGRDHLYLGQTIGREICRILDEETLRTAARDRELMALRSDFSRDLHDGVLQSLAGAILRLSALKDEGSETSALRSAIDEIGDSLKTEQQHVREMVERLRMRDTIPQTYDLARELPPLLARVERHWNVAITMPPVRGAVPVPAFLHHQVQQILREAVANAVRHGSARSIDVGLEAEGNMLRLTIGDDGGGFPGAEPLPPRSIRERVGASGGFLTVTSRPGETVLAIAIPMS